jgi:hypothetical protein
MALSCAFVEAMLILSGGLRVAHVCVVTTILPPAPLRLTACIPLPPLLVPAPFCFGASAPPPTPPYYLVPYTLAAHTTPSATTAGRT